MFYIVFILYYYCFKWFLKFLILFTFTPNLNKYRIKFKNIQKYEKVIIEKHGDKSIPKNQTNEFNIDYLFLKDIYYSIR